MKYDHHKVDHINIAYIGGGSREWAIKLMQDLALEESLSGTIRLYDIDSQAAIDNEIIGNRLNQRADVKGHWQYKAENDLKTALIGADFIILSILPGTFKEMAIDVHLPEKYGIFQPVGDTVGPGGLMRALRTIPIYVEFAEQIKKYAPHAWVINYTNPMTICIRTLYTVFPQIKAFGCCHEVFDVQSLLASVLKELKQLSDIRRSEIKINVLGINHFTWIDQAYYQGINIVPLYQEFAEKYYEKGYTPPEKGAWEDSVFHSANRVKFDLFLRYGLIAAAGDRHLAEFLPPWYLKDPETVHFWKFHLTSVDYRIQKLSAINEWRRKLIRGEEQFVLNFSGEEGVRQIKALLGLDEFVTNVNLPNQGQMEGLPKGAVVETNARFSAGCIRPVLAGRLPAAVESLVIPHALNQDIIVKAGLLHDKNMALNALLNDPLTTISPDKAEEMLDHMIKETKSYLSGW